MEQQLPPGVYYDRERRTALVYKLGKVEVYFLTMRSGSTVEAEKMHANDFVRVFTGRWPLYPLRRAARHYLDSLIAKSDTASSVLRGLMRS